MSEASYQNFVMIIGKVQKIKMLYEEEGKKFYEATVRVNRTTPGKFDDIPVFLPDWVVQDIKCGMVVKVYGDIRRYKNTDSSWQSWRAMVHSNNVHELLPDVKHCNNVVLIGDIEKVEKSRTTPLTNRIIRDFSIRVMRKVGYRKNEMMDRIHCIAWESDANYLGNIPYGTKVTITGRVQLREFVKKHPDETETKESVLEVSCQTVSALH